MPGLLAAALTALFAAALGPLPAQVVGGSVSGTVIGPSGDRVPAAVAAVHAETGRAYRSPAMREGTFVFPLLPPGAYDLTPTAAGLAAPAARVSVRVGTSLQLRLEMALETLQASVEAVESTPLVEAETAALGTVIGRDRMRNLPLSQRVFLPLTLLAGGTHASAPGSELSLQNDSGFHVSGGRETSNNFLLDGIDNNDVYINRIVVSPPLDSVREFRLHASGYKAEFGRSAGGQVNVVSRSGTRELHGTAYHYLRNEALDAANYFDPADAPQPPYRRGQFGGALGGPLPGPRAFFFAGFEGTRIDDAATRTASVPTAAQRAGDFSGSAAAVIDPLAAAPFPDSRVPVHRQDPAGAGVAGYWPGPNRRDAVQNFVSTPAGDARMNQVTGRLDHDPRADSRAFARFNSARLRSFSPFADSDVPGFGSFTLDRGQHLAAAYSQAFSPLALLEVRAGFNRLRREVTHQNAGRDISSELGIAGLTSDPRFVGFPGVHVGGYASLADDSALPILRASATLHVAASLTRATAKHRLKWGGELRRVSIDGTQGLFGRGQFNFLGAISQHPVADLLLGFPTFSIQTVVDNDFRQRAGYRSVFAQDDWTLAPRLTLSAGLRYEYNAPVHDAGDRFSQFDLNTLQLVEAAASPLGRAGYAPDRNDFAPRLGIAWNPLDSTVLRAAYGVYYDVTVLEANSGLYFNPPYFDLRLFLPSQSYLPRLSDPFSGPGIAPPASVNTLQPDYRTGYAQHWHFGIERALPGQLALRASYVGSKATKLLRRRNLNQPAPGAGEVDARRPTPGFANIVLFESGASSSYHSGVLALERRFGGIAGFRAAYTWAKSIDDASAFLGSSGDQSFPQDSRDFRAERGLSNFDQRRRLALSLQLASPFRSRLLGGWQGYAIASAGSGRPLTPRLAFDNSNTGNTGGIFGTDRPDRIAGAAAAGPGPGRFLDAAAFAAPAPLAFGNSGRNIALGPGFGSVDLAVVRSLRLAERSTVELRLEAFNIANRINFDLPERTFGQPAFGRSLAAGQARQLQLGLRLAF